MPKDASKAKNFQDFHWDIKKSDFPGNFIGIDSRVNDFTELTTHSSQLAILFT